ncbi:carph-isopro domain-containing protein [Neoroseomonas eburnea]|uniref:carph-isopro domain-containing protein n=1 Tax=Neoroseomonas eburnea TaxID=1346889 RepID=UPI0038D0AE88
MDHTEIIARLGGIDAVARGVGRHRSRISDWRRHGIPPSAWVQVAALAARQGMLGVTLEVLAKGKPKQAVPPLPRGRRPATAGQPAAGVV